MITKEELQKEFPDYKIHGVVSFREMDFFILIKQRLSFHVEISKGEEGEEGDRKACIEVWKESKKVQEWKDVTDIIKMLKQIEKEYEHN